MKKVQVKIEGITPLIMNNPRGIDPLLPFNKKKKEYTSKRIKTEDDLEIIRDLEWRIALYEDEAGKVVIPSRCIKATISNGGKKNKLGKTFKAAMFIDSYNVDLQYKGPKNIEELSKDFRFKSTDNVVVSGSAIMKTRPKFPEWALSFTCIISEELLNIDQLKEAIEFAGSYVGLCDWRPDHGKFKITEFKEI